MKIFDQALGVHSFALQLSVERAEIIASNLANVDTPGFQARDINYKEIMAQVDRSLLQSEGSSAGYLQNLPSQLKYRVPFQASADGNTAELNVEQANFANNAMNFETSLTFLNMKLNGLHKAINGE